VGKKFDEQFVDIERLAWYPWVGDKYKNVFIIGESNYDWNKQDSEDFLKSKKFTRNKIQQEIDHGSVNVYSNIEKAYLNKRDVTADERKIFWDQCAYMNLVQRVMSNSKEHPKREDFKEGWEVFWEVQKTLKPSLILVIGTTIKKIQTFRQMLIQKSITIISEKWSDNKNGNTYEILFHLDDSEMKNVVFLKHTGSYRYGGNWEQSAKFFHQLDITLP